MSRVLILIGMSGSGKTTAGQALARLAKCDFVDSDEIIERDLAGKTIETIFKDSGESEFRRFEKMALTRLFEMASDNGTNQFDQKIVVATGGGMPLFEDNFARLKELGTVVYLKCNAEILASRLIDQFEKEKKERPVLNLASGIVDRDGLIKKLLELIQNRVQTYEKAQYCIDTTDLTPKEVVERLKAFL